VTIALLGYGIDAPEEHLTLAQHIGEWAGKQHYSLACGGFKGTLAAGLNSTIKAGGDGIVILEEDRLSDVPNSSSFNVLPAIDTSSKHKAPAQKCDAAIAIGGGPGSLALAKRIVELEKPLLVISGTDSHCEKLIGLRSHVKLVRSTSAIQELQYLLLNR